MHAVLNLLPLLAALFALSAAGAKPSNSKLVGFIKMNNVDAATKELYVKGIDVNEADARGNMPMIEAVKTKNLAMVELMLQHHAMVQVKSPSDGTTPLHHAFEEGTVEIARVLLAYGAGLNVTDNYDNMPRDVADRYTDESDPELKGLVSEWDAKGAMAFEDPPTTWVKASDKSGNMYWFNVKTATGRWTPPPSSGWRRVLHHGHPAHYTNSITGQTITSVPPSLSWRKIQLKGKEPMWYNWVTKMSYHNAPDEMPEDLLTEAASGMFNVRWLNDITGETSWTDPKYHSLWRAMEGEGGRIYYYNVETGESSWDLPAEMAWKKVDSPEEANDHYFFNTVTKESVWEKPRVEAWIKHTTEF